jgi:integrase
MSVRLRKTSPYYQFEFEIDGKAFSGSTKRTSKREAERFEADMKAKIRQHNNNAQATSGLPLRLGDLKERYWEAIGRHHAGASNTQRLLDVVVGFLGPDKLITDIKGDDVDRLIAWRRLAKNTSGQPIKPATINDTTEQLKKLFTYAKGLGIALPNAPTWRAFWLKVPPKNPRRLEADEAERLAAAIPDDYRPYFAFLRATGMRANCARKLRWDQVNWARGEIMTSDKGSENVDPITDAVRAILWPLRGHHEEFVFTYVADRTRTYAVGKARAGTSDRIAGMRYRLTNEGTKTAWRRARAAAVVTGFRRHDLRADFASTMLSATGDLEKVQQAVHHKSITTTAQAYARGTKPEVRAGIEAAQDAIAGWCAPPALSDVSAQKSDAGSGKRSGKNSGKVA